jgi:uncharacterized protein
VRADRKLVIDTNLWISRLLVPGGTAARAVDHGLSWGIPLMSEETLRELSEVLARARFDPYVSREDRQHFLRLLGGIVRLIPITQRIAACRDPKDDKFLDVALNGEAQADPDRRQGPPGIASIPRDRDCQGGGFPGLAD